MATLALNLIVGNLDDVSFDCLSNTLDSLLSVCDECVIVCNGDDKTYDKFIGTKFKAIKSEWHKDFAEQRNIAIDNTDSDYIMFIDSDDQIKPETIEKIKALKQELDPGTVHSFVIDSCGIMSFSQIRIFPNNPLIRFTGAIHETIEKTMEGQIHTNHVHRDIVIIHTGYNDPEIMRKKCQRNLEILLKNEENSILYHYHIANCLHGLNRKKEAIDRYLYAIETYPCGVEFKSHILYKVAKLYQGIDMPFIALHYYVQANCPESLGRIGFVFENNNFIDLFFNNEKLDMHDLAKLEIKLKEIADIFYAAFKKNPEDLDSPNFAGNDSSIMKQYIEKREQEINASI